MKALKIVTLVLVLFFTNNLIAQNIGIGTAIPDASAKLEVTSTNSGVLIPRMSKSQRNTIASPANGLMVFQNAPDSVGFYFYSSSTWQWLQNATKPLGKTFVVLKNDITNAQAAIQLAKEIGTITQYVRIENTTALTAVDLSGLGDIVELKINNNAALTTVVSNTLTSTTDGIEVKDNAVLNAVGFPSLQNCGYFNVTSNALLSSIQLNSISS